MTLQTPPKRVSFQQLRRLIQNQRLSRLARSPANVQFVQDACRRIGLGAGAAVIDVGCGPLGALATLAQVVGPTGTVVGLDHNPDVLRVADHTLQDHGLGQVLLVRADINDPNVGQLVPRPWFDAAYCRLLLVNQRDPVATLRHVAALVRPGGHVIAHELLFEPGFPFFDPPVPAFTRLLELMDSCMRLQGKHPHVARQFQAIAQEAGMRECRQRGLFDATPTSAPDFLQEQGVGLLMVFKQSLLATGLADSTEINELVEELKIASTATYRSFFSWIFVELIAVVPEL